MSAIETLEYYSDVVSLYDNANVKEVREIIKALEDVGVFRMAHMAVNTFGLKDSRKPIIRRISGDEQFLRVQWTVNRFDLRQANAVETILKGLGKRCDIIFTEAIDVEWSEYGFMERAEPRVLVTLDVRGL